MIGRLGFGTKLESTSCQDIFVSHQRRARLRVRGRVHGWLQVADERRWRWGAVDDTFVVRIDPEIDEIIVRMVGLGGRAYKRIACAASIDISAPPVARTTTRYAMRTQRIGVTVRIEMPRIRRLRETARTKR